MNRTVRGNPRSAKRISVKLAACGFGLSFLAAASVSAAPALFTGVGKQAGGLIGYTTLLMTIAGPTAGVPGVVRVKSAGGFTVPANAFSRETPGYAFSLASLYYTYIEIAQRNKAGSLAPVYLSPNVPVIGRQDNVAAPAVTGTPRAGFVRVTPGPNGFGGRVAMDFTKIYRVNVPTSLGILRVTGMVENTFGGAAFGDFAPGGPGGTPFCCRTYPLGSPSGAAGTAAIGSSRGPWVTGMAYAYAPNGPNITSTTQTAADARGTGFDTGVISLVTPRIQYIYQGDGGGTLVSLRDSFAVIHSMDLTFVPQPRFGALIASGLAGLVGLARLRLCRTGALVVPAALATFSNQRGDDFQ